ncbi:hypothetical protein [Pseudocitrobacter cyperus]|uniref:Uncharacterized protein n=1 Tax=Pseudocitrobacter cyperus TaxID=3112843 RepID=A0ABV0HL94_9ENTR
MLLVGLVWFGCWRLWLDSRYFRWIDEENNQAAGEALCYIWHRERLRVLTFSERQSGALKQYRLTMRLTGIMWLMWVLTLLMR